MQRRRRVVDRRLRLGPDRTPTLVHQHNPLVDHILSLIGFQGVPSGC